MRSAPTIGIYLCSVLLIITISMVIGTDYEKQKVNTTEVRRRAVEHSKMIEYSRYPLKVKSLSRITNDDVSSWGLISGVREKRENMVNGAVTTKRRTEGAAAATGKRNKKRERERELRRRKEMDNKDADGKREKERKRKRDPALTRHARKLQRRKGGKPHKETARLRLQRGQERRILEKQYLVENRTLKLLESKTTRESNRSSIVFPTENVRDVLFGRRSTPEKIGEILTGNRGAPIALRIADLLIPKASSSDEMESEKINDDQIAEDPPLLLGKLRSIAMNVSEMNKVMQRLKKKNDTATDRTNFDERNYRYDYEKVFEDPVLSLSGEIDDGIKSREYLSDRTAPSSFYFPVDDKTYLHDRLATHLYTLFQNLKNTEDDDNRELQLLHELDFDNSVQGDLCQKWLDCKEKLEEAFLGPLVLAACPCHYPSSIFYEDKIWDERQEKYFRWRDVSGETERLDVYKPGATYCIRSLLSQGGGSAAAQHCCYDDRRRLLTRGSGAGNPNFISPEVSPVLHERIDILPWRLCKGDFSRFNRVRPPNNENRCKENPDDEEYQRQINKTKHY